MRADLPLYYIDALGEVRRTMNKHQTIRAAAKTLSCMAAKATPLFLLLAFVLLFPAASRADNVTLNTGSVSVQVPLGQTSISIGNSGTFSLSYFNSEYFGPLVTAFSFQSITQGFGSVTFQGQSAQFFTGSVSLNNSVLTGEVTGFQTLLDAINNNPLFTVTFSGDGSLVSTSTSHTFTITGPTATPTPEPTTLLLIGSGLIAVGARARRNQAKPRVNGFDVTG
jgi:PEP-CTERM motif-containing protein